LEYPYHIAKADGACENTLGYVVSACGMSILTLRQQELHSGRTWQGQPGQLLHERLEAPLAPQPRPEGLGFRILPNASNQLHTGRDALLQKKLP
jgi:hypothetical protein